NVAECSMFADRGQLDNPRRPTVSTFDGQERSLLHRSSCRGPTKRGFRRPQGRELRILSIGPMPSSRSITAFRAPSLTLLATEPLRALFEFVGAKVGARAAPVGDGHPVIVYPGLGGGALTTAHLRSFLIDSGYEAQDWGGG